MVDDRYNRWQGLGIAQLSVAVALISGLSVAGLSKGNSLMTLYIPFGSRQDAVMKRLFLKLR